MARRRAWVAPGIFALWKPVGPTSHDMVDFVRSLLPRGAPVGHAGTLDPFAEGVLPICMGGATRLADAVGAGRKTYLASARLDQDTETGDPTGAVVAAHARPAGDFGARVREAARGLTGTLMQVPPAYSARRVGGQRAYDLARAGAAPVLEARPVEVDSFEVLEAQWPTVRFRVVCGRGTYVRSLALDLGRALGVGGHLVTLAREAVGRLTASRAKRPFELLDPAGLEAACVPLEEAMAEAARVELPAGALARVRNGQPLDRAELPADAAAGFLVAYPEGGRHAAAVLRRDAAGRYCPDRVFPPEPAD